MPDYRILEAKQRATKVVRTMLKQETEYSGSQLRIMAMENYGLSGRFIDEYIRELVDEGYAVATFAGTKVLTVKGAK
jgi:predicted transcriptional regulator